jgi:hypothetical protein
VDLRLIPPAIVTALVFSASVADAATCYVLFDRYDNVVYRNTVSPVDLSEQGADARAALRQRGDYLMVMESDRCAPVTFVFGAAGSKTLSLDQTVGGFPPETPAAGSAAAMTRRGQAQAPASSDRIPPANTK